MRIALISQPFDMFVPPSMNSIGIWVNEVSRELAKEHDVIVYGRRGFVQRNGIGDGVDTQYVFSLPVRWMSRMDHKLARYRAPLKPLYSSSLYYLEYILPIALDLRRRKVDIVHLQNFSQFIPVIRALNPHIKIALHMRCEWLTLLDYQMIDRRLNDVDWILGVSNSITDSISERFPQHAHKCHTAYTGIDTQEFSPSTTADEGKAKAGAPDERMILFVSRITPEKGVHVLLEAFRQLAQRFPDLHLYLVGAVASLPKNQLVGLSEDKQIRELEIFYAGNNYFACLENILPPDLQKRVHFTGNVPHSTTLDYYRRAEILINPALNEPFGRSLIEANACGVPIIASRAGGMVELIEPGKNGFLVEPGNAGELAQAISILLEDNALRQRMGKAGRQFVIDHFSWDKIIANLLQIYHSA